MNYRKFRTGLIILVIIGFFVDFATAYFLKGSHLYELNWMVVYGGWGLTLVVFVLGSIAVFIGFRYLFDKCDEVQIYESDIFYSFFIVAALCFFFLTSITGIISNIEVYNFYEEQKDIIEENVGREITYEELDYQLEITGNTYPDKKAKFIEFVKVRWETVKIFLFALVCFIIFKKCYDFRRPE